MCEYTLGTSVRMEYVGGAIRMVMDEYEDIDRSSKDSSDFVFDDNGKFGQTFRLSREFDSIFAPSISVGSLLPYRSIVNSTESALPHAIESKTHIESGEADEGEESDDDFFSTISSPTSSEDSDCKPDSPKQATYPFSSRRLNFEETALVKPQNPTLRSPIVNQSRRLTITNSTQLHYHLHLFNKPLPENPKSEGQMNSTHDRDHHEALMKRPTSQENRKTLANQKKMTPKNLTTISTPISRPLQQPPQKKLGSPWVFTSIDNSSVESTPPSDSSIITFTSNSSNSPVSSTSSQSSSLPIPGNVEKDQASDTKTLDPIWHYIDRLQMEYEQLQEKVSLLRKEMDILRGLLPPNPCTSNRKQKRQLEVNLDKILNELEFIEKKKYDTGLLLTRTWKTIQQNGTARTDFWARSVGI